MATLSKWGALIAGICSLAGTGQASAATPHPPADSTPLHSATPAFGEIKLRLFNNKIYISDQQKAFQELDLGNTPEAKRVRALLNKLLPDGGTVTLPLGPSVVADGGAMGTWSRPQRPKGTRRGSK